MFHAKVAMFSQNERLLKSTLAVSFVKILGEGGATAPTCLLYRPTPMGWLKEEKQQIPF